MTTPSTYVYVDLAGALHLVGRPWTASAKGRETATFEYDDAWLAAPERFSLEPALALGPIKPRVLSTAIGLDDDPTASLELALAVSRDFTLSERDAIAAAAAVGRAVARWRDEAAALDISPNEVERMSSAFEHEDLDAALAA